MPNVFLSYARENSAKVAIIAKALSARGWSVWWDRTIPPGKTFDDVIEEALDRAACVVVLWSRVSVSSNWVRAEAAEGARRSILVPALLEAAKIPLEFRRVQAANLTSWSGAAADPEFEQFVESIAALIQPAAAGPLAVPAPPIAQRTADFFERTSVADVPEKSRGGHRSYAVGPVTALVIVTILAGGLTWWLTTRDSAVPAATGAPRDQVRTVPTQPGASPVAASDPRVDVPLVVGLPVDDAREQLERIGLSVGDIRERNEGSPPGTIAAQRPAAGDRVNPGSTVDLVVAVASATPPPATPRAERKRETRVAPGIGVPDLTGLTIEEARDRVARRGLAMGSVTGRASERMPASTVLSQEPAAGTLQPPGTPVSLVIAEAPPVEPSAQVKAPR